MNFDGKYELVELVAANPEAFTFRARNLTTGNQVYVHILSGADRSIHSIATSSAVVSVLEKSESEGKAYIVTNLIPGFVSLREALARQRPAAPPAESSEFTKKFGVPAQAEPGEFTRIFQLGNMPPAEKVEAPPSETVVQQPVPAAVFEIEKEIEPPPLLMLDVRPVDEPPPPAVVTLGETGASAPLEPEKVGKFRIPDSVKSPSAPTLKAPPQAPVPPPASFAPPTLSSPPPRMNATPAQGADPVAGEFTRLFHPPAPSESHSRPVHLTDKTQEKDWAPQISWGSSETEGSGATGVFMPPSVPRQQSNPIPDSGPSEFTRVISTRRNVVDSKPDAFSVTPPPQPAPDALPKPPSNRPLILALLGLLLLAIIVVLYFAFAGD